MLTFWLTTGEALYLVVLSVWIVLEKRSPAATVAWICALAALPWVGLGVYFILGPRRLVRRRLRRQRARLQVRGRDDVAGLPGFDVDDRVRQLAGLAATAAGLPPSRATGVVLLKGGSEKFDALVAAVEAARHHVHLGYYIFEPGRIAARLRDALVARAAAGVEVRLLVDAVGSYALAANPGFLAPLRAAGGEVAAFNPVRFARFRPSWNFRNHRKIVVVDGRVGFLGGVNVADEYVEERGGGPPWRDLHMKLEGDAVRALQLVFLEDWYFSRDHAPHGRAYYPDARAEGEPVQIVASGPDTDWQAILKVYFAAIAGATQRVWVATPYFVPDEALAMALVTAALRKVDVRVLVPELGRNDSRVVAAAARSYYDDLLAAGVRIFEYQPAMFHAKSLVVDDAFASIGSANFDNRSFRLNFEVAALLYDRARVAEIAGVFERDLDSAREVKAGARARLAVAARAAEAGARLLSPLL